MALTVNTFKNFIDGMTTQLANGTTKVNNFRSGSVALAFIQSVAANALNLQQLIVHVFNTCRLATSFGSDVDTFVGDWGLYRLPAVPAAGLLTLTRQITSAELTVAPGGTIQTPISQTQFQLIADTTGLANWDAVRMVYFFPPGVNTISVRVQAVVAGALGNVGVGTLTQIVSGFAGVNSASNAVNFVIGADRETDAALKTRFVSFISSLQSSNLAAVRAAITGVQAGLSYAIIEYFHFSGAAFPAGFTIVVDDGTGNAGITFLNSVTTQVNATRAAGAQFEVQKPANIPINVAVTVSVASNVPLSAVQQAVVAAVRIYINSLGVNSNARFVNIGNAIQNVPGVFSYSNLTINGVAADVTISNTQLAQTGTIVFV